MSTIHIPARLENASEEVNFASFYPDAMSRFERTERRTKSNQYLIDSFGLRNIGHVVADHIHQGCSSDQRNVINYTGQPIVCLDNFNRVQIIPPCVDLPEGYGHLEGTIFIELVQGKALQNADVGARIWRRYAELGTHAGNQVSDYYYTLPRNEEAPKYVGNNIQQLVLKNALQLFEDNDGSFYHPETDLVFMTLDVAEHGDIVVHPRTDSTFLSKKDFDNANDRTITHQIQVNNKRSSAAYVNIGGDVFEVPNLKNPNLKDGVYIRRFITRAGSRSRLEMEKHFDFKDPACPLIIFDSEDSALTNGQPDKLFELSIARTKRETEEMKAKLAKTTTELAMQKADNDKLIEADRLLKEKHMNELKQLEAKRIHEVNIKKAKVEEEKTTQAREENTSSHRMRMLEIGGKIILAVAGIVTTFLSLYRLKRI